MAEFTWKDVKDVEFQYGRARDILTERGIKGLDQDTYFAKRNKKQLWEEFGSELYPEVKGETPGRESPKKAGSFLGKLFKPWEKVGSFISGAQGN